MKIAKNRDFYNFFIQGNYQFFSAKKRSKRIKMLLLGEKIELEIYTKKIRERAKRNHVQRIYAILMENSISLYFSEKYTKFFMKKDENVVEYV